jgi:Cd2+/Zn2+-exporting ATPase
MSDACCGGACAAPAPRPADESTRGARLLARLRESGTIVAAGGLIALAALLEWAGHEPTAIALYLVAIAASIPVPARRAWRAIRRRLLDMNVLMVIAVLGAVALGDWMEAATVVWLFGIAQLLETRSLERAHRAIRSVLTLAPAFATLVRDGSDLRVPVEQIVPGDRIVVRPGERIPVDGVIVAGASAIDQRAITGESRLVDKSVDDDVFAGTVNGSGALEVEATRPAADSTLARIVRLIDDAQRRRAPVQTFVDGFARRYTPAVVVLALFVAFMGPLATGGLDGWIAAFPTWSYRALALLVVACPCALVISTPVSIVSALTAAAREGVLIKGGAHLERLAAIGCVAFDKTGTLTDGQISVTDILALEGSTEHGVLRVAASLEARSEHPIGRAIVEHARVEGVAVSPGERYRALPGFGAEALVGAETAVVGNHRLFEQRQLCTPALHAQVTALEDRGTTPVLVGHAGAPLGVLTLSDQMRDTGRSAVQALRGQGVTRIVLLTGDRAGTAESVRSGVGLDEAHAELLPHEKVEHIMRLRATYGPVAMVGDGVNDAPALAAADVGIAMGVAGTDVALETADVALMTDDLQKLPYAVRLGRAALSNIRWNVGVALGLKLAFVGLAAAGAATLWMAVLADTGASLIVTANSLRLLRVR